MRKKGKLDYWNHEKAYGFIQPLGGGKQVFVHISAFQSRDVKPAVGLKVSFELATDKLGRLNASKVLFSGEKPRRKKSTKNSLVASLFAIVYLIALIISVKVNDLPIIVVVWQLLISVITYMVYARDKSAARTHRSRNSEGSLHALSLFGGWPGALIAQQHLRHKSQKKSFRIVFGITVLLSIGSVVYLHTDGGSWYLEQFWQLIS